MQQSSQSRPLDALAVTAMVVLCLTWGFNQVAIKLAIHDIPPLIQAVVRSMIAVLLVAAYAKLRGQALFKRDGTLLPGIIAGILFALEFLLIYRGLIWTSATRAVLFIYLAPFFVVIGSRWFIPGDHFYPSQWIGLVLSFVGMVIAFGLPTPASDPHQMLGDIMMVGAAGAWGATTLVIKASALNRISSEKTMLYQLVVSTPLLAVAALGFG
ncbi:MAG: DMT family transporter, partial [Hyphomicrobiales bacterium]|nr:DMT family transporter [Hyphomicrobiales bacterium]